MNEEFINKILFFLGIISLLLALNVLWASWYGAVHIAFHSNSLQKQIWYEGAKVIIGFGVVAFLSFYKKKISFFIMLIFFPYLLPNIFSEFSKINQWNLYQFSLISQLLAVLGLLFVATTCFGLYSWYQLWQANKTKAS